MPCSRAMRLATGEAPASSGAGAGGALRRGARLDDGLHIPLGDAAALARSLHLRQIDAMFLGQAFRNGRGPHLAAGAEGAIGLPTSGAAGGCCGSACTST